MQSGGAGRATGDIQPELGVRLACLCVSVRFCGNIGAEAQPDWRRFSALAGQRFHALQLVQAIYDDATDPQIEGRGKLSIRLEVAVEMDLRGWISSGRGDANLANRDGVQLHAFLKENLAERGREVRFARIGDGAGGPASGKRFAKRPTPRADRRLVVDIERCAELAGERGGVQSREAQVIAGIYRGSIGPEVRVRWRRLLRHIYFSCIWRVPLMTPHTSTARLPCRCVAGYTEVEHRRGRHHGSRAESLCPGACGRSVCWKYPRNRIQPYHSLAQ